MEETKKPEELKKPEMLMTNPILEAQKTVAELIEIHKAKKPTAIFIFSLMPNGAYTFHAHGVPTPYFCHLNEITGQLAKDSVKKELKL